MVNAAARERAIEKAMGFAAEGRENHWKGRLVDVTCTEQVLHGLQDLLPIKIDRLGTIVCGLGGGYSLMGLVCGAVSGAVIAIGLDVTARTSNPVEARYYIERATRKFIRRFEATFGSTLCRQLTGIDFINDPDAIHKMREGGLQRCSEYVKFAIRNPFPSEEHQIPPSE